MKSLILGTAGHIDHGKTLLIKALTGIDTDRLQEEKRRGISIDLGFAHFTLPSGIRLGIVDVPGHERFVRNMLAGASGIDLVLLVVAADDSVMPQTREHLAIIDLLGIKKGVVAITKVDLVDKEWLDLVIEEVRKVLQGTALKKAPIIPVSAKTGFGLKELIKTLDEVSAQVMPRKDNAPFRLPIDRVFSLPGAGTIVTGTLWSGEVRPGEIVSLSPGGKRARIRSVQVHGRQVEAATAGQRVALNLAGLSKDEICRGDVILKPGFLTPSLMIDAEFKLLPEAPRPIKNRARVRLHHGTAEVLCRIVLIDQDVLSPGDTAFVQLRLEKPIVPKYGDHFVIRSYSPIETIGGGRILDSHPIKYRPSLKNYKKRLLILASEDVQKVVKLAVEEQPVLFAAQAITRRTELLEEVVKKALDSLVLQKELLQVKSDRDIYYLKHRELTNLKKRLLKYLDDFHKKNPLQEGIDKQQVKSDLFALLTDKEFEVILAHLVRSGEVRVKGRFVSHPDLEVKLTERDKKFVSKILAELTKSPFSPPDIGDLVAVLKVRREYLIALLDYMTREKMICKATPEIYFETRAVEKAKKLIQENFSDKEITPSAFRKLLGTSRKYALPLLNYFDAIGITRRVGDIRYLR